MADMAVRIRTLCLHAGQIPDAETGAARRAALPDDLLRLRERRPRGEPLQPRHLRQRLHAALEPDHAVFEQRMAAIEGGRAAVATASGQAAEMVAFMNLLEHGDHVVSSSKLYGGSYAMLGVSFAKLGIEATFVDPTIRRISAARSSRTPRWSSPRRSAIPRSTWWTSPRSRRSRTRPASPSSWTTTAASPYLCQPFAHGADIVVHSATKYIGGHGTTMGGVVVESGSFPGTTASSPG